MILGIKKFGHLLFALIDILIIILCSIISMVFLGQKVLLDNELIVQILLLVIIFQLFLNIFRLYQNMIRYEMGMDYIRYVFCSVLTVIIVSIINIIAGNLGGYYRVNVLTCVFSVAIMIVYRIILRSILNNRGFSRNFKRIKTKKASNLLIIGPGMRAREIVLTIRNHMPERYNIVGLIDDDMVKLNHKISGVKVLGTRFDIPSIVLKHDVDLIFFAINRIDAKNRKKIFRDLEKYDMNILCKKYCSQSFKDKMINKIKRIIKKVLFIK